MKRPSWAGLLLLLVPLLLYFLVLRLRPSSFGPAPYRPPPPHRRPGSDRPGSADGDAFRYGVMFDAGSTGTRVHVFRFRTENQGAPRLDKETFRAIKPGLSAYADDPQQCSAGVLELLGVARSCVPAPLWARTPVVLKATAGLRMLPAQKAAALLDRVRALFQESPFLSTEDAVSIMDGTDEGIFAWITVNFLTGGLQSPDRPTVGMLDLGGGSTQITFSPADQKTVQTSPSDDIRSFQMFNRTHTVYTHSYLGLGLMSARLAVLGGGASSSGGSTELVGPCLAPGFRGSWAFADAVYSVSGQRAGEPVYEACLSRVQKLLHRKLSAAPEAADVHFYAFSFYYDRAADLGLIDQKDGGTVRVSDFVQAAERVCRGPPDPQQPLLCLDLVYVSELLQRLGLLPRQELTLTRTIHQVETSWALGATFHHLEALRGKL